jgi:hypothetical protein
MSVSATRRARAKARLESSGSVARAMEPFEKEKQRVDTAIAELDRAILRLDAYFGEFDRSFRSEVNAPFGGV